MKIKLKETKSPNISNIIFHINKLKDLPKGHHFRNNTTDQFQLKNKSSPFFNLTHEVNKNACFVINHSGLIPRNPRIKTIGLFNERQPRQIKSITCAKQIEKRFPVRKILGRNSTFGSFRKKEKGFQFESEQKQLDSYNRSKELLKNDQASDRMMTRSHSLFGSNNKKMQWRVRREEFTPYHHGNNKYNSDFMRNTIDLGQSNKVQREQSKHRKRVSLHMF